MKIKTRVSTVLSLVLGALCCQMAYAEEETEAKKPVRAAWIMPMEGQAPWLDARKTEVTFSEPEWLASGKSLALFKHSDGYVYAADAALKLLGRVILPEQASWVSVDDQGRILVHDGARLLVAQSWEDAAQANGFVPVLDIPNVKAMDGAGGLLAYADATNLSIVDLTTGSIKRIAVSDFFDDAKCAAMTPEAIQQAEAEATKKTKKKSKTKVEPPAPTSSTQVADVTDIWWRADGTGIVRVRSLLNVRTFITRDGGKSWTALNDAPRTLMHQYGWIWDGVDRVLSADGKHWVQVCGPKISVTDRLKPTYSLKPSLPLPSDWLALPSPVLEVPGVAETAAGANAAVSPVAEPASSSASACVEVPMIPAASEASPETQKPAATSLYAPEIPETGFRVGLYSDAVCSPSEAGECTGDISRPGAWQVLPDGNLEPMTLPDSCLPVFIGSSQGLGILMCKAPAGEVTVYVRTAETDWIAETVLPESFAQDTRILSAADGTIVLTGACADETTEIELPAPVEEDPDVMPVPVTMTRTVNVCSTAVRLPEAVSQPDIWRIERVENAHGYIPLNGGRLLTIEAPDPAQRQLVLRATDKTEAIVDHFEPSPWQGLVMTGEGCLALYDGSVSPDVLYQSVSPAADPETGLVSEPMPVKLLSVEGRLADLDCASSRAIAELPPGEEDLGIDIGDDHYGLRAGAGGFFTMDDVQTWFMRIEALIPIYHGNYEVGLMYRMAGGNTSSSFGHLGIVSVRWRYDNFELFDFAVGAGIGYGSMCGYDKTADPAANDEDDTTIPSGYAKCSQLSMRYLISGIATYKITPRWKIYMGAELLGGTNWGFDISGGLEVRF